MERVLVGVQWNSTRSPFSTLPPSLHEYPGSMPDTWEVLCVLGDKLERSVSGESERRRKFTGGGGNGWRGGSVTRGEGEGRG
jgi:hypothetical protein